MRQLADNAATGGFIPRIHSEQDVLETTFAAQCVLAIRTNRHKPALHEQDVRLMTHQRRAVPCRWT
eukprot:5059390-Prymnesium_polylepis.2